MSDVILSGLADSPESSLKMLVQEHPEVVILDMDFGGQFNGLDIAKTMQKTRVRAAIVMLVPELDPTELKPYSRRFGSSWSYVKKTTAGRLDVLEMVLKSAVRGVQWIEPDLSRPLQVIWKVAEEARDMETRRSVAEPTVITSPTKIKNSKFSEPGSWRHHHCGSIRPFLKNSRLCQLCHAHSPKFKDETRNIQSFNRYIRRYFQSSI